MKTRLATRTLVTQSRKGRCGILSAALAMVTAPAFAQIAKVDQIMTNVESILRGVAVTIFTIALLWVAFKMAFQHAKWAEVSNIVIGGIIAGGSAGIASWLIA
jgi:type IV secretion system protein VirB2